MPLKVLIALWPRNSKLARVAACALSAIAVLAVPRGAHAGNMDLAPERLATCKSTALGPSCSPNQVAWANLMSELGMAIAPTAFHAARTTGLGGFSLSLDASFTKINENASAGGVQYWHEGTQGPVDPNNNKFSIVNSNPDSILGVYSLKARKGLAYGFEIAGSLGYVGDTSLWVGGADVRWALLEGYRTGVLGYFPDIAIGGGVRTVGGSSKFFLTTVGLDAQLSKPFSLADSAVITPYLGVQRVIIIADSTVVDLTPNTDPLAACGYLGPNVPGNPNASVPTNLAPNQMRNDGTPLCKNQAGGNADFNNDVSFRRATVHRWRGLVGVNYRFEVLYLAGQFAFDLTDPGSENGVIGVNGDKQWTMSFEAGVFF